MFFVGFFQLLLFSDNNYGSLKTNKNVTMEFSIINPQHVCTARVTGVCVCVCVCVSVSYIEIYSSSSIGNKDMLNKTVFSPRLFLRKHRVTFDENQ